MLLNTGLRIAQVQSQFLSTRTHSIVPLVASRISKRSAAPIYNYYYHCYLTKPHRRFASTSTTSSPAKETSEPPKSVPEIVFSGGPFEPLTPASLLNPPATTRPPPLDLPVREPSVSLIKHLFRLGKAYTTFYKSGIVAIYTNYRLLTATRHKDPTPASAIHIEAVGYPTRADALLYHRVIHDIKRLPIFGILLIICGELTPLIVLLFPRLTPYTCRIPKQIESMRASADARRAASLAQLRSKLDSLKDGTAAAKEIEESLSNAHICRSLGLTSPAWDKLHLRSPFTGTKARKMVQYLVGDDTALRINGGVDPLVDEEVVLACEERGISVLHQPIDQLRTQLENWLRQTAPHDHHHQKPKFQPKLNHSKKGGKKEHHAPPRERWGHGIVAENKVRELLVGFNSKKI
ncbi:uncharacterized protein GGS25DRAFT_510867 [Hypoxylon fragiforme]|uniref:uncharacterized protein n=1 Tax=Hypoxylon fragiforme TaxID=63214 RepID=UPI0020C737D4|nr:uncharacterized protein GGS25DRAFT_510867 [Hypoxylon fragiforme]KAI2603304.1 hypothetical protein GGS25DRAFT_510867 [Hypoxylon fragiforme]